ncbi:MAG: helix-turn-helix transcriptional regulator [Sarcina sp.]
MNLYGNRLKVLRLENGLTKSGLNKLLGLKNGTITQIENGTKEPTQKIAAKLAAYFETDIDFWLDLEKECKTLKYFDIAKEIASILDEFEEEKLLNEPSDIFQNEHLSTALLNIAQNFYIWRKLKEQDH